MGRVTGAGDPVAILFVCHGNICRSTMAEYVMRHLVHARGLDGRIVADSAATSSEEIGNGVHPGTRRKLRAEGIPCGDHRARQLTHADLGRYDLIVAMDGENLRGMRRILGSEGESSGRVHLLLDWSRRPRDIADPWYTGDFDATYADVREGCESLLEVLVADGVVVTGA